MRRRVLLVQPSMQPPGGGNGVAAWMLQALAPAHDVTVLSWRPVDVAAINRFFGTNLNAGSFAVHMVPSSWRHTVDHLPIPASLLRSSLLMRYTRRVADGFDVIIGAHNETDYGRRGIQYVHYPTYLRPRPDVDLRWYHAKPLLDGYYRLADRIAGFSVTRMKANLTLANSDWTAAKILASLAIHAETLYPPVVEGDTPPPWPDRRRGFVAMGRISPEKEYERLIRILARVRRHMSDVTLTIVGTFDRATRAYMRRLAALVASLDAHQWVSFRPDLTRDQVRSLIAGHRYGIHGMREEHFGMAPAEMARGGMIVWVPNGGGQVEIVGNAPLLRYDTDEQAAEQILAVISNPREEQRLREHLAHHSERFAVERFVAGIRATVNTFVE
jgi:glycosyltransferase involved in cell wall biosynthesis